MNRDDFDVTIDDLMHPRNKSGIVGPVLVGAFLLIVAMGLLAAIAGGQDRNVPSSARREIAMRGEQIERIDGQVRASLMEDVIGQAAESPPDDSGKWHITLLTIGNCQACERLKSDIRSKSEFRDWVDAADHAKSWAHYHELRYDGDIGREWGRRLEHFLGRKIGEFPTLIVQPPVNGAFGKHTEVVFLQHGYDGNAEKLTAKMAEAIGKYCAKLKQIRMVARGGHRQAAEEDLGAGPPPFLLAPTDPPATGGLTLPSTIIPPRLAATIDEIKQIAPDATADFLLAMVTRQATIEEVRQAWQVELIKRLQEQSKKPSDQATPATGFSLTTLIVSVLTALIGTGGLGGLIVMGLQLFRRFRQATGKAVLLDDAQFQKLTDDLKQYLGGLVKPPIQF